VKADTIDLDKLRSLFAKSGGSAAPAAASAPAAPVSPAAPPAAHLSFPAGPPRRWPLTPRW